MRKISTWMVNHEFANIFRTAEMRLFLLLVTGFPLNTNLMSLVALVLLDTLLVTGHENIYLSYGTPRGDRSRTNLHERYSILKVDTCDRRSQICDVR